ncbi:hypothetical protein PR202_ga15066 [Eleusine coracana subsp. coracana]|uniref:Uncharacterized protein n=1 Tax=Eleusine coracana subsp. coracana TaxID=191504 RepID=A0AAV5CJ12_ELECO|nr:hypothetical protein PR202_ga15066 [Eleusine coracana subsp. coracana]
MFLWRFAHNSLPNRVNLKRRKVNTESSCPICKRFDEDYGHLFFKCKTVKAWWQVMGLDHIRNEMASCQSGREVMQQVWKLEPGVQTKIITFLWRWWTARNKANSGERVITVGELCHSVEYHYHNFQKLTKPERGNAMGGTVKWKPPVHETYKLNIDASFLASSGKGWWGFVVRDQDGQFLEEGGGGGHIFRTSSALHAEAIAVWQGLERAAALGMPRVVLETDATILGKVLSST